jgi:hypothetical protein
MALPHAHSYWRHRFAADRQALEKRRILAMEQAGRAATALGGRWRWISSAPKTFRMSCAGGCCEAAERW